MSAVAVTVTGESHDGFDPAKVATWCKVVDRQARECAERWGIEYTPVVFFSTDVLEKLEGQELTDFVTKFRLLTISAELDEPGVLGYHGAVLGVIFARVKYAGDYTSVILSHEVLEQMINPLLTSWSEMPDGRKQAVEACDRVEDDTYNVEQDGIFVRVSNYLLPSAFVPYSARPWDRLGKLSAWDGMTPGGYMIVREADGDRVNVFAAAEEGIAASGVKRLNPFSRATRLLAPPVVELPPVPDIDALDALLPPAPEDVPLIPRAPASKPARRRRS